MTPDHRGNITGSIYINNSTIGGSVNNQTRPITEELLNPGLAAELRAWREALSREGGPQNAAAVDTIREAEKQHAGNDVDGLRASLRKLSRGTAKFALGTSQSLLARIIEHLLTS